MSCAERRRDTITTIEKLYYGHIRPHKRIVDPESRLAVLQDLLVSSDEDLTRLLPENCKGAYDSFKAAYKDLGSNYYNQFNTERKANNMIRKLKELGYDVTIATAPEVA